MMITLSFGIRLAIVLGLFLIWFVGTTHDSKMWASPREYKCMFWLWLHSGKPKAPQDREDKFASAAGMQSMVVAAEYVRELQKDQYLYGGQTSK